MNLSSFNSSFGVVKPQTYSSFAPSSSTVSSPPSYDASGSGLQSPTTLDSQSLGGGSSIQGLGDGSLSTILQAVLGMVATLLSALSSSLGGNSASQNTDTTGATTAPDPSGSNGGGADSSGGSVGGGCHHSKSSSGSSPSQPVDPGNNTTPPNPGNTTPPASGNTPPGSSSSGGGSAEQQQFLQLINNFRSQNGLQPVKLNDKLDQTAVDYAKAMSDSGQMTHTLNGTSFDQRMKDHGYNLGTGTENIAEGQQSVQEAFTAWCSDEGHRANLLNPSVTEIGLGHVGNYWDQEGAAPL